MLLKTLCSFRFAFLPRNYRDHFQSHRIPVIKSSLNVLLKHFQKKPPEMFCKKKLFLKNSQVSQEKLVLESVFGVLQACNIIKKRPQHSCFLAKFPKFLRTPILKNICERLLPYFRS